ncbi:hypothetical protein D3C73_642750 [compost metagenome]
MTYTVQNSSVKLPATEVNPVPYIYVNGKIVEAAGVSIQEGSTYADASFIKQHIDSSYLGNEPVALRSLVEKLGSIVEFLPAVGDTRAAVLIYTK